MKFTHNNVPLAALHVMADQLREHGASVTFETESRGVVESEAGRMTFELQLDTLTVELTEDCGHFSRGMLVGGVRQMVEEAVEGLR